MRDETANAFRLLGASAAMLAAIGAITVCLVQIGPWIGELLSH